MVKLSSFAKSEINTKKPLALLVWTPATSSTTSSPSQTFSFQNCAYFVTITCSVHYMHAPLEFSPCWCHRLRRDVMFLLENAVQFSTTETGEISWDKVLLYICNLLRRNAITLRDYWYQATRRFTVRVSLKDRWFQLGSSGTLLSCFIINEALALVHRTKLTSQWLSWQRRCQSSTSETLPSLVYGNKFLLTLSQLLTSFRLKIGITLQHL